MFTPKNNTITPKYRISFLHGMLLSFSLLCITTGTLLLFFPSIPQLAYPTIGILCAVPFFITFNKKINKKIGEKYAH